MTPAAKRNDLTFQLLIEKLAIKQPDLTYSKLEQDFNIKGISDIFTAKTGDVSFVADKIYIEGIASTQASLLIITKNIFDTLSEDLKKNNSFVVVPDAKLTLARATEIFQTESAPNDSIHASAQIHETAVVGNNVNVGSHVSIGEEAEIGNDVNLYPGVVVGKRVKIAEVQR